MKKIVVVLLVLAALALAGCGTFAISGDAISALDATATAAALEPAPPQPTPLVEANDDAAQAIDFPAPAASHEPADFTESPGTVAQPEDSEAVATAVPQEAKHMLPAPLYYLNPEDNQVWRVEQDGRTLTPVSAEGSAVEQYAVNPVDGSVALLTDNDLILIGATGQERRVIVDAAPQSEGGVHWYLTDRISNPVWSPDGQTLAYGQNGIRFYHPTTGDTSLVLPNGDLGSDEPVHVYTPNSFAPDGGKLLLLVGWYQSGGAAPAVLHLNGDAPLVELQGAGFPCCTFSWSQDSSAIFAANDSFGMLLPGLWRSDAATGETTTVVESELADGDVRVFDWPVHLEDDQIAVFTDQGARMEFESGQPHPMTLATVDVPSGALDPVGEREWLPGEVVWFTDGNGLALTELLSGAITGQWPPVGSVYYLSAPGAEATELPVAGRLLAWGAAGS